MLKNSINSAVKKIQPIVANPNVISNRNVISKMHGSESVIPKYGAIFDSLGLKPKCASKSWRG